MLYRIYECIRIFYFPFFVWLFPPFSKSLKNRISFEKRNHREEACVSFGEQGDRADLAFEVSSEGELEQIRPAMEAALESGKKLELVFSSASVEKQCQELAQKYPDRIRILRYPLLTYFPGSKNDPTKWITASALFLCRYDFFPELLRYGRKKEVEFILLSGSLKSYERKGQGAGGEFYKGVYSRIYKSFDKITAATEVDAERFKDSFGFGEDRARAFDFRPIAIERRLAKRSETLQERFPGRETFLEAIRKYPLKKRLVFGSFWDYELAAFSASLDYSEHFVCIFPHRLDRDSLEEIVLGLKRRLRAPVYVLGRDAEKNRQTLGEFKKNPGPVVVNLKGILCECYPDFGAAFVGGGHGVSVHSLMEPFLGGCMVYCGPRVQRSTEYDLILEHNPDRLRIVDRLENVFDHFKEFGSEKATELSSSEKFRARHIEQKDAVLAWLGIL